MRAYVLTAPGRDLEEADLPVPVPREGQVLIRVEACGVCRTDVHLQDGELREPKLPVVPGHQIAGTVAECGPGVTRFRAGERAGVPWLGWTCGACRFCAAGRENLCPSARFTGYTLDGGFAEYTVADERYAFPLPPAASAAETAPLLCAGLIGYRSLKKTGGARALGIYGFGAAAHIVTQVAVHQGREVYAFTRAGDRDAQTLARELGAVWAGSSGEPPPRRLEGAIIFAPAGALVPKALEDLEPGGTAVCGGIHMSDIPRFPYSLLWEERTVTSVANLTRRDAEEFLELAPTVPVRTRVETLPLARANEALDRVRRGKVTGALVLLT